MLYPRIMQPTHAKWTPAPPPSEASLFSSVPARVSATHLVADTLFVSPAETSYGIPGPDGDANSLLIAPNGLEGVSADVLAELPPDCRAAFEQALAGEREWKGRFLGEGVDGMRGRLRVGYAGFPV